MRKYCAIILSFSLFGCSDFFNPKKEVSVQTPPPASNKPFPDDFDPNHGQFSEYKFLANIGLNVIVPRIQQLRLRAEILLEDLEVATDKPWEKAQANWTSTMLAFHRLESLQVGPMADKNLRFGELLYSWPLINPCGIDHEVVKLKTTGEKYQPPTLFTLKGLAALEYLLFDETIGTKCNPRVPRNKEVVEWAERPRAEKILDRLAYAKLAAKDILELARKLESYWDPKGANFTMSLVDGSRYPDLKTAINGLSDALFFVEAVKDRRLAMPLGLHADCKAEKCPADSEHPLSNLSFDALTAQVDGFRAMFLGEHKSVRGFGFDDYLKSIGRQDVADSMTQTLDLLRHSIQEIEKHGSLISQIENMDPAACRSATVENPTVPVCGLYQTFRQLAMKLKTEFLVALSLKAPPTFQGDND